jgi:hypothetical protein
MSSSVFGIKALMPADQPHILGFSGATPTGDVFEIWTTATNAGQVFKIHANGDVICGPDSSPELATTATGGFLFVRTCNGTPTGVPTNNLTGRAPVVFDRSGNKLWVYDAAWIGVALS